MGESSDQGGEVSRRAAVTRTRALFEQLASTEHRRKLTADKIFRQLRKEEAARRGEA